MLLPKCLTPSVGPTLHPAPCKREQARLLRPLLASAAPSAAPTASPASLASMCCSLCHSVGPLHKAVPQPLLKQVPVCHLCPHRTVSTRAAAPQCARLVQRGRPAPVGA